MIREERGSAVVEFVLVGMMLTFLTLAVLQLALALHIRNTVLDAAAEGARFGALADNTPSDGVARTIELITSAIGPDYAGDVTSERGGVDGVPGDHDHRADDACPSSGRSDPRGRWRCRAMRWSRRWTEDSGRDDRGSASLEFIVTGLLLLVPLVYLVLAVSAVQAASLAVEGAARQASRVFVQADSLGEANAAAARAVEVTLADYGLDASDATVAIACRPHPSACLTRQGFVTVTVRVECAAPARAAGARRRRARGSSGAGHRHRTGLALRGCPMRRTDAVARRPRIDPSARDPVRHPRSCARAHRHRGDLALPGEEAPVHPRRRRRARRGGVVLAR